MDASEPTDPSSQSFDVTREELQRTFDYQVQRLREIDTKAIELFKANLLLFGLVVTAGSILVQTEFDIRAFLNVFTVFGTALLLLSTWLAGIAYTSSNLRGGLGVTAVEDAVAVERGDLDPAEYRVRVLESYGRWIEYNARVTAVNDMFATVTVILIVVAFVYIGAGLLIGIVAPGLLATASAFVGLSIPLGAISLVVYRMDAIDTSGPRSGVTYDGVLLSKGASRSDGFVALREMLTNSGRDTPEREP